MSWQPDICASRDDAQPHVYEQGRCSFCLAPIEVERRRVEDEQNRQYWAFTRTARGQPVEPAVTRRLVYLEREARKW